jgi:hypothetical protein
MPPKGSQKPSNDYGPILVTINRRFSQQQKQIINWDADLENKTPIRVNQHHILSAKRAL